MSEKLSDRLSNIRAFSGRCGCQRCEQQYDANLTAVKEAAQLVSLVEEWQQRKRQFRQKNAPTAADFVVYGAYGSIDDALLAFDLGVEELAENKYCR